MAVSSRLCAEGLMEINKQKGCQSPAWPCGCWVPWAGSWVLASQPHRGQQEEEDR